LNLVLVPLLIAAASCPPARSAVLVGRWESQRISKGGVGHVMDFRNDGSFVQSTAVTVNLRYSVSGDQLTVSESPDGQPSPKTAVRFHVDGSSLTRQASDGSTTKAERLGKPEKGASQLVGVWRYRHYTGGIAFERYARDGNLLFRLPMTSATGCYSVDSETHEVQLSAPDGETKSFPFAIAGDELQLPSGNDPHGYQRSPFGLWYDIDHIDFPSPAKTP